MINKNIIIVVLFFILAIISPLNATALDLGLHMDLTYDGDAGRRTTAISKAKSINAKVSRNSFLWHKIELTKGNLDWSLTDSVVNELLSAGIEPLFCIYGSPTWANGVPTTTSHYYLYVPTDENKFQDWLNNYASFVSTAVSRYKGKVKKWELWNEENEHYFWKPKPNIDQYIRWFQAVQSTIKSIDPTAEIALGGLAGLSYSGTDDYNGKQFLTLLYQKGILPDIVAIHPYSSTAPDNHQPNQNNFDDIALINQAMIDYGQSSKPIWVTEWGWATNIVTQKTQADWLNTSLGMIRNIYTYVLVATYFIDYDRPPTYYQGLFTSNFQPKLAASVFSQFNPAQSSPSPPNNLTIIRN